MSLFNELYRVKELPVLQNRMFYSEIDAINCDKGDMILVQNLETGLIFNNAFEPELMAYNYEYQNEQAVSSVFQAHLSDVAKLIRAHFKNYSLIEVGCGKGYFLEYLQHSGFEIIGLDPTYEGSNPKIIKEYFTASNGLRSDGIILRHVLEHVQNPIEFLINICKSNAGKGKIYIEVPCFDWICHKRAWFDIFYEHVNYFRIADFERMFGCIYESGHVFGGQYLYVVADLATVHRPEKDELDKFDFPSDFLKTVDAYAKKVMLGGVKEKNTSVVWGGASKGVIFSLFMQRSGIDIDFIIDINPAKQGKFLPSTGLKVNSFESVRGKLSSETNIFVMNNNYLDEIKDMTSNKFNYLTVDHGII